MALDGYIEAQQSRQARAAELLDQGTEAALARAWRDHGDRRALDRLIRAYMRLAIAQAARFRRYGAPMDDLTQEAALGLMKAAERFDPDRGVRFSTYATYWIKAQVQDFVLRNWSLVRTGSTSGQKSLFFNLARLKARFEREARSEGIQLSTEDMAVKIAAELGVTLNEVRMMETRMSGGDASLHATAAGDEDGREWIDTLPDNGPSTESQVADSHDGARLRSWLSAALEGLSSRERFIVAARKLREDPRTLESLGEELGLSKERVRQLEAAAYSKLKKALAPRAAELSLMFA